jgi:hypothetical protein
MVRSEGRRKVQALPVERLAEATHTNSGAPRTVTTFRVGKIVTAAGQMLCLVRTLSDRTVGLDIEVPFAPDARASLEIGKERLDGELIKLEGKKAELRTARPIDLEAILADSSILASGGRRALPRVEVDARARIEVGEQQWIPGRICDISTDGMKVFTDDVLCTGDRVRITMKGLDSRLGGSVRWCDGDYAGVEFDQPLTMIQLNLWLAAQAAAAQSEAGWSLPIVSKS